jgi:hypothetical protein
MVKKDSLIHYENVDTVKEIFRKRELLYSFLKIPVKLQYSERIFILLGIRKQYKSLC